MINGTLHARQNNNMSLSCWGTLKIKDSKIISVDFKGMPRARGEDSWASAFSKANAGEEITQSTIDWVLGFDGNNNVVAKFTSK